MRLGEGLMTAVKYLVRGATFLSKPPSWAINNTQPTMTAAVQKSIPRRRALGRLGASTIADVHAQPADPKRSLLRASLEVGSVALFLYATQAAIGFSVGFVLPWLFYFGVMHR